MLRRQDICGKKLETGLTREALMNIQLGITWNFA